MRGARDGAGRAARQKAVLVSGSHVDTHVTRWVVVAVVRKVVAVLVAASLLSGCFGDPAPEPEQAPLEVVVGSSQSPGKPCLLNRDEVAAGTHELMLVSESGSSTVTIRDDAGSIVFRREVTPGSGQTAETLELREGKFVIECAPHEGAGGDATLMVVPARPDSG